MERAVFLIILAVGLPISALASVPSAENSLTLGPPRINGSSCPVQRADAVYDSQLQEIRVGFDGFSLQAGGPSPLTPTAIERSCNVRFGVRLPAMSRLKVTGAKFGERIVLPTGAEARLEMSVHRRGEEGQTFVKESHATRAPEDALIKRQIGEILTSSCGDNFDFEINTTARVANPDATQVARLGLSRKDLRESAGQGSLTSDGSIAVFKVEVMPCTPGEAMDHGSSAGFTDPRSPAKVPTADLVD